MRIKIICTWQLIFRFVFRTIYWIKFLQCHLIFLTKRSKFKCVYYAASFDWFDITPALFSCNNVALFKSIFIWRFHYPSPPQKKSRKKKKNGRWLHYCCYRRVVNSIIHRDLRYIPRKKIHQSHQMKTYVRSLIAL